MFFKDEQVKNDEVINALSYTVVEVPRYVEPKIEKFIEKNYFKSTYTYLINDLGISIADLCRVSMDLGGDEVNAAIYYSDGSIGLIYKEDKPVGNYTMIMKDL